jgi:branched-chain amino acid transport system permease protein
MSRGQKILLLGLALLLPIITDLALGHGWVRILDFALLYIMLALGLNIVVGYAGLLDLGYVAFFAVGAYCNALLSSPHFNIHLPLVVTLPLGALIAAAFGVLLGAPTLRLRGDYLAIVTLGFGEIIRIFLNNLNSPINITNGPQGIDLIDPLKLGPLSLAQSWNFAGLEWVGVVNSYYLFLLVVVGVMIFSQRLEDSRIGRAWSAIREDEIAARSMGLNTRNLKLLAFAMGATLGGLSGGLFAAFQGFVSPESFTLMESVMILCMVVLGGMGHIAGVVMGALILSILPEALRGAGPLQQQLFGQVLVDAASLRLLLFGVALIVMMLLRPEGIFPAGERKRELHSSRVSS